MCSYNQENLHELLIKFMLACIETQTYNLPSYPAQDVFQKWLILLLSWLMAVDVTSFWKSGQIDDSGRFQKNTPKIMSLHMHAKTYVRSTIFSQKIWSRDRLWRLARPDEKCLGHDQVDGKVMSGWCLFLSSFRHVVNRRYKSRPALHTTRLQWYNRKVKQSLCSSASKNILLFLMLSR